jgi:hypothetical protein
MAAVRWRFFNTISRRPRYNWGALKRAEIAQSSELRTAHADNLLVSFSKVTLLQNAATGSSGQICVSCLGFQGFVCTLVDGTKTYQHAFFFFFQFQFVPCRAAPHCNFDFLAASKSISATMDTNICFNLPLLCLRMCDDPIRAAMAANPKMPKLTNMRLRPREDATLSDIIMPNIPPAITKGKLVALIHYSQVPSLYTSHVKQII